MTIHQPALFEYINKTQPTTDGPDLSSDSTYMCQSSYESSLWAIGSCIEAADIMLQHFIDENAKPENYFVLCRPPGHHSESNTAQGFCLFNNIAVCASHLQERLKSINSTATHEIPNRVMIFDFDVHHGNGTEKIFYQSKDTLYISTHLFGDKRFYPYTGSIESTGKDEGEGFNVNIPLPCVNCGDEEFLMIIDEIVIPLAQEYSPSFLLISAGYDIMEGDSVGRMLVTPKGIHEMVSRLQHIPSIKNQVLCVLEGGYSHSILAEGVCATVQSLLHQPFMSFDSLKQKKMWLVKRADNDTGSGSDEFKEKEEEEMDEVIRINPSVKKRVKDAVSGAICKVKEIQGKYWKCFSAAHNEASSSSTPSSS
ncbi:putative acetoin utilization protein [Monocercomonoides exilis]|uniref:putative acetoin utilization protein n=1 Tax=Monocercomonoides exilis TaxID=2049356 RepID=UPI00355A5272|nr:putative acetoin utilization protein [Monocercomonoides exilis]|eukprot:MONOS_6130.1-p1 / transcript=MONOS_6130.1 / gene=MONOS_6130 / organism=Monocercomonoides_exilis_PA203 / gene_product=acetoin utilization protein / transcript_product=acetoin utilization protein / location=Mono_scaffold00189:28018-30192(-) / protein_length=366 / sequence_SO=supercontig / SO=protein_coding / is_pseudo=false